MRTLDLTHSTASGLVAPAAPPGHPPEPQKPHSTPPHSGKGHANMLTGRALKVTIVLNAAELLDLVVRDGQPRVVLRIEVAGHLHLTADISAKSARRAIAAVREHGADGVAAIVQGKLVGDRIDECGLAVQPKTPKPAAEAVAV